MKFINKLIFLKICALLSFCSLPANHYRQPKLTRAMRTMLRAGRKTYQLSREPIDVVFVCHPKDFRTLDLAIEGIRNNGKNIRRIIVVSSQKLSDQAEWFDEAAYPFSKRDIALEIFDGNGERADSYIKDPHSRIGWIYQQFLKLYAVFVIPDISSNVLIIDADTIFLNETQFMDDVGNPLFNISDELHPPYFLFNEKVLPGSKRIFKDYSGISHHMFFQKPILEDLFQLIRSVHNMEPWIVMCKRIDHAHLCTSAVSEYELYFNFVMRGKQGKIRPLRWQNMYFDERKIDLCRHDGFNYVSCHSYRKNHENSFD